jgi:transposase-like protein
LLEKYKSFHGYPLKPIKVKNPQNSVPKDSLCHTCRAIHKYLYFNDGKKRSQLKCKVCGSLSQVHLRHRSQPNHFCPYCERPLFVYKTRKEFTIFKCQNKDCSHYLKNKKNLNYGERLLFLIKPFEFKLHYQFREYHFKTEQLIHSSPEPKSSIQNIRNSLHTLSLVLTFHITFGISARKTAYMLREVFELPLSYQSVLNYCEMAAYHCHKFNLKFKGDIDNIQAGDETYIKISGKHNYCFFFISSKSLKISAYHIDDSRDTLPATVAISEAIRTALPQQNITLITDGNPAYQDAVHFLNQDREPDSQIDLKNVIGLQNLDSVSEEFRPFKQLIERLNRTYKFHIRSANGFTSNNGAVSLTTLFVTFYNFLRPHMSLKYRSPIELDFLKGINTIQNRWAAIIQYAILL